MAGPSIDQLYQKRELRDHIYKLPDTYIGNVESTQFESFVYDDESKRMVKRMITYVPGLYKIYDEILVNSMDHEMRLKAFLKAKKEDVKALKAIHISIDPESGWIEVMNDGDGIDVVEHPTEKVWVPQLIFGELLTSTNYDANEEKLWGGRNGYGAKLTNIFSKEFIIETVDHRRKKLYTQVFKDNMTNIGKPSVKASSKAPYTKIRFLPDYQRFGLKGITDDIYQLFRKRALDACATTDASVAIYFNEEKLAVKTFEKYVDLYLGDKTEKPRVYEACGDRWEVVATYNDGAQFEQASFVNGIVTSRGGKHVDYIADQISKRLAEMATTKLKKEVKPKFIKENLHVFVKCLIVNPAFDTQTKDALTTPVSKFGSKCELSDKFFASLYKTGIIERANKLTDFHDNKKMAKNDGKKTSQVLVEKLDDANWAGTKRSSECTLILCEGDSAKSMAIAGLSVVGRDRYGVFPLRGKLLNVKDAAAQKIADNKEISNLKKILGLQHGKDYKDTSDLRYGHIMIMCDQDHDGSHIKGLLFNMFQSMYPSLFKLPGFITSMLTPIIKATNRKGESINFYSITDFDNWKEMLEQDNENGTKGWKIKYYKGLGTSSEVEAKEYFKQMNAVTYTHGGKESDEAIDLAFNKKRADDRKAWLMKYNRKRVLDFKQTEVPYEEFIHKELIHFSNADLERSINHMCDGLKESTRKIMFGCFKKRLFTGEIKVAQLAAYIAEVSAYHHGEQSLMQAIIGMAQNFIGSNNVNLLSPNGQFGTRIMGGADAASPRYIFTVLSPMARTLFREADAPVLTYLEDDGVIVEPEYYIPIVPLVLINGAQGIGTGFSTTIPCHNPEDVINMCLKVVAALDEISAIETKEDLPAAYETIEKVKFNTIKPWYLGFKGSITSMGKENSYTSKGVYEFIDDTTVEITELPVGTWTDDYKDGLMEMLRDGYPHLKSFESHCTTKNVRFLLKFQPTITRKIFETDFKMASSKNLSLNNMHLYGANGAIKKFDSTGDIVREWSMVRIRKYLERKLYQLKQMEREHKLISAKVKFIQDIIDGNIVVNNKKMLEVVSQLKARKYPTFQQETESSTEESSKASNVPEEESGDAAGYMYLTRMPIYQLTTEKKKKLEKEAHDLKMQIEALRAKPIHHIWKEELEEFQAAWKEFKETMEEEYAADLESGNAHGKKGRRAAPKAVATGPKKKVVAKKKIVEEENN